MRVVAHDVRRAAGDQPAPFDDVDAVAHVQDQAHVVIDQQDARPRGDDRPEVAAEHRALVGVQAGGRLVEQEHPCAGGQRPAQPDQLALVTMAAGIAAIDAVRELAEIPATLKWPNDVVVDDAKLAGILAEKNGEAVVVGLGCNVQWDAFPADLRATVRGLKQPAVVRIDELLSRYRLPAELLILEITETVMLSSSPVIDDVLARIRRLGVQLAVDDFGTGFSSFTVLTRLPVQEVKIDREFVVLSSKAAQRRRLRRRALIGVLALAIVIGIPTLLFVGMIVYYFQVASRPGFWDVSTSALTEREDELGLLRLTRATREHGHACPFSHSAA